MLGLVCPCPNAAILKVQGRLSQRKGSLFGDLMQSQLSLSNLRPLSAEKEVRREERSSEMRGRHRHFVNE